MIMVTCIRNVVILYILEYSNREVQKTQPHDQYQQPRGGRVWAGDS